MLVPDVGRALPFCFARILAGSATSPSVSLVIMVSRSLSLRVSTSSRSASSSLRDCSSEPSDSESDPPSEEATRDEAEDSRRRGVRVLLGPESVIVDEVNVFLIWGGDEAALVVGGPMSGLWTGSVFRGDLICPCGRACPSELSLARTPRGRSVLVPGTVPDVHAKSPVAEDEEPLRVCAESRRRSSGSVGSVTRGKYSPCALSR